jgi:hypothetical protein
MGTPASTPERARRPLDTPALQAEHIWTSPESGTPAVKSAVRSSSKSGQTWRTPESPAVGVTA